MSIIYKKYANFKGINRSTNTLTGTDTFAYEQENLDNKEQDLLKSRKGFSYADLASTDILGYGEYIDTQNNRQDFVYFLQNNIMRVRKEQLTINFSGPHTFTVRANDANDAMSLFIDSTEFDLDAPGGGSNKISDVITAIAGSIGDYSSSSATGSTALSSVEAWSLQVFDEQTAVNSIVIDYYDSISIVRGGVFSNTYAARNNDDFEQLHSVNLNGNLYITSPYDGLVKYDGIALYKAGFPEKKYPISGRANAATNANYYCELFRTDANGNVIRSGLYPLSGFIDSATAGVDFYLRTDLVDSLWDIGEMTFSYPGVSLTDTITKVGGVTIEIGQYISFKRNHAFHNGSPGGMLEPDSRSNVYVRKVTNIVGTTYTLDKKIDGFVVTNMPCYRHALRAAIYRSADGGGDLYYYVGETCPESIDTTTNTIRFSGLYTSGAGVNAGIRMQVTNNATVNGFVYSVNGRQFIVTAGGTATITATNIAAQINSTYGNVELIASSSADIVTIAKSSNGDYDDNIELLSGSGLAAREFIGNVNESDLNTPYYFKRGFSAIADSSTLLIPNKTIIEPPKCKYISVFRNQIALANDGDNQKNIVYYTDILDQEAFADTDSFLVGNSDNITGLKGFFNGLYVFKNTNTHLVQGDLDINKFQVDDISKFIGCISHKSIIDVDSRLYFLSRDGFRFIEAASNNIKDIYRPVKDLYLEDLKRTDITYNTAAIDRFNETILFTIRTGSTTSDIYVFNYILNTWTLYKDMPVDQTIQNVGNEIVLLGTEVASSTSIISKINSIENNKYAYMDGRSVVDYKYTSHFEDLQDASVFKKWLRFKLFSNNSSDRTAFTSTIKFLKEFDFVTEYASTTFSFLSTIFSKRTKMANKKIKNNAVSISGSVDNEIFEMTGYEYEIDVPYRKRIKE